ncbi:hypothetical protein AYO44_10395 [Planctomycetaceae bacterium SCGC AG-212-F19]|nr:hypothetical protein AYO44_10395 [Planctomycetaceae bacterium SCGC AG-212-F19]
MKRIGIWSIGLVLLAACRPASAWEPYPPGVASNAGKNTLFADWLANQDKPAQRPASKPAKPAAKPAAPVVEKDSPPVKPATQVDEAAGTRQQELQVLLRRQKVCFQLMQIALETNDSDLLRKAEQLDERARTIYSQRTASLPGHAADELMTDEQMLEKHLGASSAAPSQSSRRPSQSGSATRPTGEARVWETQP